MNVFKRLIPYIILNILVSAATTYAVLTWWNTNRPAQPTTAALSTQVLAPTAANPANPTPIPAGVKVVEIIAAAGAGNLGNESVTIRRLGDGELSMNGWRLDDNAGHRFTFPDVVLFKDGSIKVFTRSGSNSVNELYWGLKETVWATGKTVSLSDSQGVLRASFTIP
jgi:competence protein ComEC